MGDLRLSSSLAAFAVLFIVSEAILLPRGGTRPSSQGSLASGLAWLVPPLSLFAWFVITGRVPITGVLRIWVSNLLQNGFGEEFLFRGAVMGRLSAVMSGERALYVQALLFGLWHFNADFQAFKGELVGTFAEMIVSQITAGLALGYVTQRTGNVAIATGFHVLYDSVDQIS